MNASVAADEVAIFVLASMVTGMGAGFRGDPGAGRAPPGYSFYERRALGAAATWGRRFPLLFHVFGDGAAEREAFASARCAPAADAASTAAAGRSVRLHACDGGRVRALWARNCTAHYYGARGPCCRAEAAMLWTLRAWRGGPADAAAAVGAPAATAAALARARWFGFMDDDVYADDARARGSAAPNSGGGCCHA